MKRLTVRHETSYRYAGPVRFGEHRLILRPRDSHDLRLVQAELLTSPPAKVRWLHDVFGNSIATADFTEPAQTLTIVSTLHLERYALPLRDILLETDAATYPFVYSASDRTDLGRLLDRNYPDPDNIVGKWANSFVASRPTGTLALLGDINSAIRRDFTYQARDEEGTQPPAETLEKGTGSCRDFAYLFIEAVRSLGFGARFVTGYLYDPRLDFAGDEGVQGAGATHAWADVYLPGPGWVEFDPTNGLISAENLIRVAVVREPSQAIPISGSYDGEPGSFLGLDVVVTVTSGDVPLPVMLAATG